MFRVGIWAESLRCAGILLLQWKGGKFCVSTTFEILPLSTWTLWQQKSYASKGIQPIFEIFPWDGRCWGWAIVWKVSSAQVFYFCNGKVKTLGIDNIWNFATFNLYPVAAKILRLQRYSTDFATISTCTLCQEKSHISKSIQPIFEIFASARRCWEWASGWKVSGAIAKVKYLRTWKFPPKCPLSASSNGGKHFEYRLNTFGDMGFLLAQWTVWKWQNFKCCRCPKSSPGHCKSKISAHLNLSTQMTTLNIFEPRQRFWKSVEYHWRYRIFAGAVYKLKVAKFQILSTRKVFTLPLQK